MHSSDYRLNNPHRNIQIVGANRRGKSGNSDRLYFLGLENHFTARLTAAMKLKMLAP